VSAGLRLESVRRRLAPGAGVFDVSLEVARGECLAVIGVSGAGKTTLLRCVAGLEVLDAGSVVLGGEVVSGDGVHLAPHRRRVGMIFQELALWPHRTVEQHLLHRGPGRPPRAVRKGRAVDLLESLGIAHCRRRLPHQLSGGERQRVALARALYGEPRVVLLDEPVAHLDRPRRRELLRLLATVKAEREVAMVYVTHDREGLDAVADRVAVLAAGRLVEIGEVGAMLTAPHSDPGRDLLLDEPRPVRHQIATASRNARLNEEERIS